MVSRRKALVFVTVGVAAVAAGWALGPRLQKTADLADGAALLAVPLHDLDGHARSLLEWKGRVLVCNFWATWCAPCREEIPMLSKIRTRMSGKNVEIVGIAIDQALNVASFMKEVQIAYPVVLAETGAIDLMRRLGNSAGALPFTVVFDREGRIAHRRLGVFSGNELELRLAELVSTADGMRSPQPTYPS